jgi:sugar O-acyltransferase (sialic acid O-acetyltransferase NeuD family)
VRVVLVGASNPHTARVVAAVRRVDPDYDVVGFLDNDPARWGTTFVGLPVLGGFGHLDDLGLDDVRFVNLITRDTRVRRETTRELLDRGCRFTNLIHPDVDLDQVEVGVGNYIQEGVALQAGVQVGDHCSLHVGATVCHGSTLGSTVFVAPGAVVAGLVTVEDGVFVGVNATVMPRVTVGRWATIGAGAVVSRDVPPGTTVVAVPSKFLPADGDLPD